MNQNQQGHGGNGGNGGHGANIMGSTNCVDAENLMRTSVGIDQDIEVAKEARH